MPCMATDKESTSSDCRGILTETRVAPNIDKYPHSRLRLFTHRKAYDVDRLSSGCGPCSGGNSYHITVGAASGTRQEPE